MVKFFFLNVAIKPLLHNKPMEINDPVNLGKIYAILASGGSCGSCNSAVCDACILLPSGSSTQIPFLHSLISSRHFASLTARKLPVHPESPAAEHLVLFMELISKLLRLGEDKHSQQKKLFFLLLMSSSPPPQAFFPPI